MTKNIPILLNATEMTFASFISLVNWDMVYIVITIILKGLEWYYSKKKKENKIK